LYLLANPDQLSLFVDKQIDGAWTVEPWVSRLELEGQGTIYLEEPDAVTTVLASSVTFLHEHRDLVQKFAHAHTELTTWIQQHPEEAQQLIQAELAAETTRSMPAELLLMPGRACILPIRSRSPLCKNSSPRPKPLGFYAMMLIFQGWWKYHDQ
jgi:hypothetical protein